MFEHHELGSALSEDELDAFEDELRFELLQLQLELRERDHPLILVLSGFDRRAQNSMINSIYKWMDGDGIRADAVEDPVDAANGRPWLHPYWRTQPAHGEIGIYTSGWTERTIYARLTGQIDDRAFEQRLATIRRFERTLTDGGALILKFWLHQPKAALERKMARTKADDGWACTDEDRTYLSRYDEARSIAERALHETTTPRIPWTVVEAQDWRYANSTIARAMRDALRARFDAEPASPPLAQVATPRRASVLSDLDMSAQLDGDDYEDQIGYWQRRLHRAAWLAKGAGLATVALFEGPDAAGKGSAIRRMLLGLDCLTYRVVGIAAPTEEEAAHHYLWRFWKHLPPRGQMTIFDRSWYGRVRAERVHGHAEDHEWQRAYAEINDFESQLVEAGTLLLKFWVHVSYDKQLERFEDRAAKKYKQYKLTDEDWENRERWDEQLRAADDMIARTSTPGAPWTLVPSDDKEYSRVYVCRAVCEALEGAVATQ